MDYFVPYYINAQQSDLRGIKRGWYAMDECGKLGSGLFLRPCECLRSVSRTADTSMLKWLH